jgi:hypothetical protein
VKSQYTIRFWLILGIILGLTQLCVAQTSKNLAEGEKLEGKLSSVVFQRTYLIFKGRKVTEEPQVLGKDIYDVKGRLIQTSIYGNGEERTTFNWLGNTYTASVNYFDASGNSSPNLKTSFTATTDEMPEKDLCAEFKIKKEKDIGKKNEREVEICTDNSIRRTTTTEFSTDNQMLREFVEDSKGRTWETTYSYGVNLAPKGFRYTVSNLKRSKYWQEVTYEMTKIDEKNNWIYRSSSSTNSAHLNQIWYQYVDERKITYND